MESFKELELIQKCQAGELEEFSQLYDLYIKKIYNFVYFRTHHKETAEDLVSLIFMKALEKIASFNHKKGTFSSWLYRISRNTVIDYYRTKKSEANVDDIWNLTGNDNIERDLVNKIQLEKIGEYLQKLEPLHREIIIMKIWDGLSYKEIADITQKSEASLKMAFSRAMTKLRKEQALILILLLLLFKT